VSVQRFQHIPGFNIDRVAAAAGDDPDVLRMETLRGIVSAIVSGLIVALDREFVPTSFRGLSRVSRFLFNDLTRRQADKGSASPIRLPARA
jgi:hypothetical protein